jgi:hypothetical protein
VRKRAAEGGVMSDDERRKLVSTEQSLGMAPETPKMSDALTGLELFGEDEDEKTGKAADFSDADSFFNLPGGDSDEEDEEDDPLRR